MNPEKPLSGIHAISAPTKAPDAPVLPKPQETPFDKFIKRHEGDKQGETNRPRGWKGLALNLWGNTLVRLGLGTLVIGGGAYEAYQNVPAIHSTVDSLTGQGIPETFDNNADKQIIKAGVNAVQATEEQIQEIINSQPPPLEDFLQKNTLPTISMMFPLKLTSEEITSTVVEYREEYNILTGRVEKMARGQTISVLKKGKEIPVPIIEGVNGVEVLLPEPTSVEGVNYFNGLLLKWSTPDGALHSMYISGDDPTSLTLAEDIVKNAPIMNRLDDGRKTKGFSVPVGTITSKTNRDNDHISFITTTTTDKYSGRNALLTKVILKTDISGKALHP